MTATQEQTQTLATIAHPFNLPDIIRDKVLTTLSPFVADAGAIAREAEGVTVEDASQTEAIAAKAKAEAAAARKAARAPAKAQIGFFADSIETLPLPTIKDPDAQGALRAIERERTALVAYIRKQADAL